MEQQMYGNELKHGLEMYCKTLFFKPREDKHLVNGLWGEPEGGRVVYPTWYEKITEAPRNRDYN